MPPIRHLGGVAVKRLLDASGPNGARIVRHGERAAIDERVGGVNRDGQPAQGEAHQLGGVEGFVKEPKGDQELERRADILQEAKGGKLQAAQSGAEEQQGNSSKNT